MTATPIRTVCFDFDQTLGYMSPSHWDAYEEAARIAGLDVTAAALRAGGTESGWERWTTPLGPVHRDASASQKSFRALRAELAVTRFRAAIDGPVDEAALYEAGRTAALLEEESARYVLFDDAIPALQRLQGAGIVSVIVSNHVWTLPEIVQHCGIGDLVALTLTSAREGFRKPHPAIFENALGRASTRPWDALMVGDSLSADVRGAERAGMHAVFIDRDGTKEVPGDVRVIRSLLDVPLEWAVESEV